jgi:hypothetical protein
MAELAVFQDVQSSGVAGTAPTTTISDQPFNTEKYNGITGASLSSNEITLPAGDYIVNLVDTFSRGTNFATATAQITDDSNNVLDSTKLEEVSGSNDPANIAVIFCFNLAIETAIKYRFRLSSGTGSRLAQSQGTEHYQKLIIQKVG